MNIVSVTLNHTSRAGGTPQCVDDFTAVLGGQVVSFTASRLLSETAPSAGVLHVATGSGPLGAAYGWPCSRDELRRAEEIVRRADFVFCHLLFRRHNDWVRRLSRKHGFAYCVVPHGGLDPQVFTYRRWRKAVWLATAGKRYLESAAGILFATERERLKAACRLPDSRQWVVNWPSPKSPLLDSRGARCRVRNRLGISEPDRVLLFLGRLHSLKRPREVVDAFGAAAGPGDHLVLAGPAEEYSPEEMAAYAAARNIRRVHVVGPVYGAGKWELYAAADGFINISAKENFGFTVAEALASGLPVLLSPGNDLRGELESVRCGWMLDRDAHVTTVEALKAFFAARRRELEEMGARGRAWASRNASRDRFRSELLHVVQSALASSPRRAGRANRDLSRSSDGRVATIAR